MISSEPAVKYIEDLSQDEPFAVLKLDEIEVESKILEDAKSGNENSQFKIAEMYLSRKSYRHAKAWYVILSEKKHAPSQLMLGKLYGDGHLGIRGKPDFEEAEKWFEKAHQADPRNIAHQVGLYYLQKLHHNKEALKWFINAGNNGHEVAQFWLGELLNREATGNDIRMKKIKALGWFQKSANQGYKEAIDKVKKLNREGYYDIAKIKEKE